MCHFARARNVKRYVAGYPNVAQVLAMRSLLGNVNCILFTINSACISHVVVVDIATQTCT